MQRRALLTMIVSSVSLTGCLSGREPGSSDSTGAPTKPTTNSKSVQQTTDGVEATFEVIEGHAPTDDAASATFREKQVTVTGTMDPTGCNRPALESVRYNPTGGVIRLLIGGTSPYGSMATVECGNASFDYRSVLSVNEGRPTAVEVVHNYSGKDNQSFNLERS